jgi:hypothetical protein
LGLKNGSTEAYFEASPLLSYTYILILWEASP